MQGIIGKSYAFETASRYGISNNIVNEAKAVYGDNSEKLSLLIERGSQLERELKQKHKKVDEQIETLRLKELKLKETQEANQKELDEQKSALKRSYDVAIGEAKNAAKAGDTKAIHRAMNKANKKLPPKEKERLQEETPFSVGDTVKYHSNRGIIVSMKGDKEAMIEMDGMKVRVKTKHLRHTQKHMPKPQTNVKVSVEKRAGLKCDLHGLRADEACEVLDKFLNDALINGWDEVIVYHGIGTGKLSYAVKNFLAAHPRVQKYEDAPQHLGGFGAKIVSL
jgi:DNA mismatch repair protein MutS2